MSPSSSGLPCVILIDSVSAFYVRSSSSLFDWISLASSFTFNNSVSEVFSVGFLPSFGGCLARLMFKAFIGFDESKPFFISPLTTTLHRFELGRCSIGLSTCGRFCGSLVVYSCGSFPGLAGAARLNSSAALSTMLLTP